MERKLLLSAIVLPWLSLSPLHAGEAPAGKRYQLDYGGNKSGSAVTYSDSARERRYTYEFQDRGRGPKIEQRVVVDEKGIPVVVEITGLDYWRNPVDERFELRDGKASWRNPSETQPGKALSGPAYYLAIETVPQEVELLARALLAAPGQTLPVLPSGQARVAKVASAEAEAGGKGRKVDLYEIAGLGFAPIWVWLDEDRSYFATDDGWAKIYVEGWEDALPRLREIQVAQEKKLETDRAARLARRPQGSLAFRNARLFDPGSGKVLPGTTVVISGNRIQAVGQDGEVEIPQGAEVIDAAGKTLMPGLWDMHTHPTPNDGLFHLASGITTVRDLGNDTDVVVSLRRRIDAGEILGARMILAGFIDGPGEYAGPTKVLVDTAEEALAAVDRYAELGYEQIKLYSSLDPKLVPAIIERAHARGMRLSGHIPFGMDAGQAVRAGFDEIQHANFLFLRFYEGVDTRTPARLHSLGEKGGGLDLRSQPVQAFLDLLKEKGTVVDPTLVAFEGLFTRKPGQISPAYAPVADRLPSQVQRSMASGSSAPAGKEESYRQAFQAMKDMVRALHEKGIPLVAGTDSMAGFSLHRELELYVEAGIPAVDALRAATIVPARVMKKEQDLGTIAPGKLADVILIDGDPTADIRDIRRVVLTVKDGMVYDVAKLFGEVGVKPVS